MNKITSFDITLNMYQDSRGKKQLKLSPNRIESIDFENSLPIRNGVYHMQIFKNEWDHHKTF